MRRAWCGVPSRDPRTAKARSQVFAKWETIGKPTIFPDELLVARKVRDDFQAQLAGNLTGLL